MICMAVLWIQAQPDQVNQMSALPTRKTERRLAALLVATLGLAAPQAAIVPTFTAGIAAQVDDKLILDSEVRLRMSNGEGVLRRAYTNSPPELQQKLEALGRETLERLIDRALILSAFEQAGWQLDPKAVQKDLDDLITTNYGDTNVFLKVLTEQELAVNSMRSSKLRNIPDSTAEQIEQYYHKHQEDFWSEESVELLLITISKPAGKNATVESQHKFAEEIRTRIAAGGDFASEAKSQSEGGHVAEGGYYGWMQRSNLNKPIADAAFAMKPGDTSGVIEVADNFFILRVTGQRPGAFKPLAEVRDDIRRTLQAAQRSGVMNHWMKELRANAFIRYFGLLSADAVRSQNRVREIEIKHVGTGSVADALVRAKLCVKEGEPLTQAGVDRDIRILYGTGDFYNIRLTGELVEGGTKVTYIVQEKPVLTDLNFTGNKKYNNRELLKKLSSKSGERLDERKLFEDARQIQKMYEAGHQQPTVKYVPNIDERTGRGSVTFEITERPE
ncbi:MAG: hypothetical protein DME26_07845 [Verrucomicrobia bacterium]|nr:MAG: hypothetical protein DME26_07845 [Verrucomicrobiota bacterium]